MNWEAYDLRPACLPNCSSSEDRFFSWHFSLLSLVPRGIAQSLVKPSDDPQKVLPSLEGLPMVRNENAPVTIVEFGDYHARTVYSTRIRCCRKL